MLCPKPRTTPLVPKDCGSGFQLIPHVRLEWFWKPKQKSVLFQYLSAPLAASEAAFSHASRSNFVSGVPQDSPHAQGLRCWVPFGVVRELGVVLDAPNKRVCFFDTYQHV